MRANVGGHLSPSNRVSANGTNGSDVPPLVRFKLAHKRKAFPAVVTKSGGLNKSSKEILDLQKVNLLYENGRNYNLIIFGVGFFVLVWVLIYLQSDQFAFKFYQT